MSLGPGVRWQNQQYRSISNLRNLRCTVEPLKFISLEMNFHGTVRKDSSQLRVTKRLLRATADIMRKRSLFSTTNTSSGFSNRVRATRERTDVAASVELVNSTESNGRLDATRNLPANLACSTRFTMFTCSHSSTATIPSPHWALSVVHIYNIFRRNTCY